MDGAWRHDAASPFMPDPLGNVNNWLFVRRPGSVSGPAGGGGGGGLPDASLSSGGDVDMVGGAGATTSAASALTASLGGGGGGGLGAASAAAAAASAAALAAAAAASAPLAPASTDPAHAAAAAAAAAAHAATAHQAVAAAAAAAAGGASQQPPHQPAPAPAAPLPTTSAPAASPGPAAGEPGTTRAALRAWLAGHTAAELVPESGRVVLLDARLPVRLAFHALHEQGASSAPVWDARARCCVGMLSASDFIHALVALRAGVAGGGSPLSEHEMDAVSIAGLRSGAIEAGRPPPKLVSVGPGDSLLAVARALAAGGVSLAPIVATQAPPSADASGGGAGGGGGGGLWAHRAAAVAAGGGSATTRHPHPAGSTMHGGSRSGSATPLGPGGTPGASSSSLTRPVGPGTPTSAAAALAAAGGAGPCVLGLATLGSLLAAAARGAGAGAGALRALDSPIGAQLLGTWSPDAPPPVGTGSGGGPSPPSTRRTRPLATVSPATPLATALALLLDAGVSALPVVAEGSGALIDAYARADITALARGGAYARLQWEDVTVGQALALAALPPGWGGGPGGSGGPGGGPPGPASPSSSAPAPPPRVRAVTPSDSLRSIVAALAVPGARRVFVIDPATRRVLAVVSLSDVAAYLIDLE